MQKLAKKKFDCIANYLLIKLLVNKNIRSPRDPEFNIFANKFAFSNVISI